MKVKFKVEDFKTQYAVLSLWFILPLFTCLSNSYAQEVNEARSKFVLLLIDETDSFGLKDDHDKKMIVFWPEMQKLSGKILNKLEPGDGFGIIGIDDHGFDADDLRVELKTLDKGMLRAVLEKKALLKQTKELRRRTKKPPYTDIFGALKHAAYFLNKEKAYKPQIMIFSDMIQTPRMPSREEQKKLKFPAGTEINCFYVNATGGDNWDSLVKSWLNIFQNAGASVKVDNFNQRKETERRLKEIFDAQGGH